MGEKERATERRRGREGEHEGLTARPRAPTPAVTWRSISSRHFSQPTKDCCFTCSILAHLEISHSRSLRLIYSLFPTPSFLFSQCRVHPFIWIFIRKLTFHIMDLSHVHSQARNARACDRLVFVMMYRLEE